jgi:hypothetical protein
MVESIDMRAHFRDVILETKQCALCQSHIDQDEEDRGIVEFIDGWYWICSECRKTVGKVLDATQCKEFTEWAIPPYSKRSRKHWLGWLEKEYKIIIEGKEVAHSFPA